MILSDETRRLLDGTNFAVLCTLNADGSPQSSVVWAKLDGDDLLMSTIRGRRKAHNLERDPRVSVCVYEHADPYTYVELRGSVTLTEVGGDELINELSVRYAGRDWHPHGDEVRLVIRLTPTAVHVR